MKGLLHIEGRYHADGSDPDVIEMTTTCLYRQDGEHYIITYKEADSSGLEGTVTTLDYNGYDSVILTRKGSQSSQLIIQKEKRHLCHYRTQFGDFVIGVYGDLIFSTLNACGGELYFKYTLDINSSMGSDNEVKINIRNLDN